MAAQPRQCSSPSVTSAPSEATARISRSPWQAGHTNTSSDAGFMLAGLRLGADVLNGSRTIAFDCHDSSPFKTSVFVVGVVVRRAPAAVAVEHETERLRFVEQAQRIAELFAR